MKVVRVLLMLFALYVGIVIAFEGLIGYFQPSGGGTLVITTTSDDDEQNDRVLSMLTSNERIYVAANHWPRAWFRDAIDNPNVLVTIDGEQAPYLAVPATEDEANRLNTENPHGIVFKLLTGFPPRYFLRLDPQSAG